MANNFKIDAFRAGAMAKDGDRPTLFRIILSAPAFVGFPTEKMSLSAKAASLPGSTTGTIEVPYWGRKIKVAGDKTFSAWTCTVLCDEDYDIRSKFELWHNSIASYSTKEGAQRVGGATSNPNSYVGTAIIEKYGKDNVLNKAYKLINCWPSEVSPVEVSWESNNQISEFTVTFEYDYFDPVA